MEERPTGTASLDHKKRSDSPSEKRQVIDDDENDESPTDDQDLWLPERNEENTKFER